MQDNDLRQAYLNAGDAAAEEMRDGRVVKGSKNTYGSKIVMVKNWLGNFAPDQVEENKFQLCQL